MHEDVEAIIHSYDLPQVPESVRQITQIVARQNSFIEEIAAIVKDDGELTAQLLRAANPRAQDASEYSITTVRDALRRSGPGWILMVAVSDPLTRAVLKTFSTMFDVEL